MIIALKNAIRAFALILVGPLSRLTFSQDTYTLATDRAALVALHNTTDGENWNRKANWLSYLIAGHVARREYQQRRPRRRIEHQQPQHEWLATLRFGQPE